MTYRRVWSDCCYLARAAGVGAALAFWPTAASLTTLVLGLTMGAVVEILRRENQPTPERRTARSAWSFVLSSLSTALSAVAVLFLLSLSPGLTLGLVVLAGAIAPCLVSRVGAWVGSDRREQSVSRVEVPTAPGASASLARVGSEWASLLPVFPTDVLAVTLGQFTDAELCRAWRRSYLPTQRAASIAAHVGTVDLRQAFLDEVERRNPTAFRAWLDAGPRPAGGPDRFLIEMRGQHPRDLPGSER